MRREERMVYRTGKRMIYTTMCHNMIMRGRRDRWVGVWVGVG
jgi:hypothetical protein